MTVPAEKDRFHATPTRTMPRIKFHSSALAVSTTAEAAKRTPPDRATRNVPWRSMSLPERNPGANMAKKCSSMTSEVSEKLKSWSSMSSVTFDIIITMMVCESVATEHEIINNGCEIISKGVRNSDEGLTTAMLLLSLSVTVELLKWDMTCLSSQLLGGGGNLTKKIVNSLSTAITAMSMYDPW